MSTIGVFAVLGLSAAVACSGSERARSDSMGTPAAADHPTSSPQAATTAGGAMAMGAVHSDSIAIRAEADLAALRAASPDSAVKLVAAHRQVVEALVADCEQMMRQMKMTPPAKWNRTVEALRQDLTQMRTASASALRPMLPAHAERVKALLDMRRDMMKM
ncbi:MAG: hypothetical protein NVS1B4_20760 [Gemmatimonadaceae bacterium]